MNEVRKIENLATLPSRLGLDALSLLAECRSDQTIWLDVAGPKIWRDFAAMIDQARQACVEAGVGRGEIIITPGEAKLESLAWLFGAAALGAIIAPLRQERIGEIATWATFAKIGWLVRGTRVEPLRKGADSEPAARLRSQLAANGHAGLILATGGTSGTPKLVLHDLAALLDAIPIKSGRATRTLPLMRFDHIGGLDMSWRALAGGQVLVEPPCYLTPRNIGETIARHRVEVMPATPSLLNLLLIAELHRTHDLTSLRVVPYGAEPMPDTLLERLRAALPGVEFVQRFGTSETGALPVKDSGGGLILKTTGDGFAWKIVDDELWVRSPSRALGYLSAPSDSFAEDGWFRTGDLAESMADGSVRVLGRRHELINVGGEKVLPGEVERVLLAHPLVVDCRVFAEPNAVLGQVVAAEVVWRGEEQNPLVVKREIHAHANTALPRHKLPAHVRLVAQIEATRNFKKSRTSSS